MAFILLEAVPFIIVCLAHQLLCFVLLLLRPFVRRPVYPWARSWTTRFLFGTKLQRSPDSPPLAEATPERPVIYCCNHRSCFCYKLQTVASKTLRRVSGRIISLIVQLYINVK